MPSKLVPSSFTQFCIFFRPSQSCAGQFRTIRKRPLGRCNSHEVIKAFPDSGREDERSECKTRLPGMIVAYVGRRELLIPESACSKVPSMGKKQA